VELGVDYFLTHSCYDPGADDGAACGQCDSCLLRLKGFQEAGLADPVKYKDVKREAQTPDCDEPGLIEKETSEEVATKIVGGQCPPPARVA